MAFSSTAAMGLREIKLLEAGLVGSFSTPHLRSQHGSKAPHRPLPIADRTQSGGFKLGIHAFTVVRWRSFLDILSQPVHAKKRSGERNSQRGTTQTDSSLSTFAVVQMCKCDHVGVRIVRPLFSTCRYGLPELHGACCTLVEKFVTPPILEKKKKKKL